MDRRWPTGARSDVVPDEEPVPAALLGPDREVEPPAGLGQLVERGNEDRAAGWHLPSLPDATVGTRL